MHQLLIPYPRKLPGTKHGAYSCTATGAKDNKVRLSPIDAETVTQAAAKCGITVSAFMRWCSVYGAQQVLDNNVKQPVSKIF